MYRTATNLRILLTIAGGVVALVALISLGPAHLEAKAAKDRVVAAREAQKAEAKDLWQGL